MLSVSPGFLERIPETIESVGVKDVAGVQACDRIRRGEKSFYVVVGSCVVDNILSQHELARDQEGNEKPKHDTHGSLQRRPVLRATIVAFSSDTAASSFRVL